MSKRARGLRRSRPPLLVGLWVAGGITVVILAVLVGIFAFGGGSGPSTGFTSVPNGYPYSVQTVERIQDRTHFLVGNVYNDYNSNPPTSGPHTGQLANWGISDIPIAKEMAVHNMEHGGIVVWYNCNAAPALSSDACTQLRNELGQVVSTEIADRKRVLMTPYDGMEGGIALTAWGFLDAFDEFDSDRVSRFIETFECNFDPENVC